MRMQQTVLANNDRSRVRKHGEMSGEHLLPHLASRATIIDADGQHTHAKLIKIFKVLRELAQFSGAIRSPVTAIEHQQHRMTV